MRTLPNLPPTIPNSKHAVCSKHSHLARLSPSLSRATLSTHLPSPVVVHSNPGFTLSDPAPAHHPQLQRSADMIYGMLLYKDKVDAGEIPTETAKGNTPLCMAQYHRIFSACRIPKKPEDVLVIYGRDVSRHIVVARGGQFFKMEVYHPDTGKPLSIGVSITT